MEQQKAKIFLTEERLIDSLLKKGYKLVNLKNEDDLILNLWKQLEIFNNISLTIEEFQRILIFLYEGDTLEKYFKLKSYYPLYKDGTIHRIKFFDSEDINHNNFQIANKVLVGSIKKNIYSINLLINGIPLTHIELNKPINSINSLYHRIKRFHGETMKNSLFSFSQIFIISNIRDTKYFSNGEVLKHKNLHT